MTGGAARLLASLGRGGLLPPSPGAAAGGRMEQGLSAITLYCAPAAGPAAAACAMEPEQVSGTAGAQRGEAGEARAGPVRGRAQREGRWSCGQQPERLCPSVRCSYSLQRGRLLFHGRTTPYKSPDKY